jgi:hypothetical protein
VSVESTFFIALRNLDPVAITIANKNFSQSSLVHETIRIKSGAWDDTGVFIYSTLNHIKYCLPQGYVGPCRITTILTFLPLFEATTE